MKKITLILVNPLISAQYLSNQFKQAGIYTVALYTFKKEDTAPYLRPQDDWFDEQICLDTMNIQEIVDILKPYSPDFVISGGEAVTPLTDQIAFLLTPELANDPETSSLRANKYFSQELLKERGLPYIQQLKVNSEAINTELINQVRFPCYCKPMRGVGSIGVFKAQTIEELTSNFKKWATNISLFDASEYIIQEYIEGDEFLIDTFSYQGKHFVSSVQTYSKAIIDDVPVYRYIEIVDDETIWNQAVQFVKKCLDVTGLKNGFGHTEIFIKPNKEERLIEINPRVSGVRGYINRSAKIAGLLTQIDLAAGVLRGEPKESTIKEKKGFSRVLTLFHFSMKPLQDFSHRLHSFSSLVCFDLIKPVGWTPEKIDTNLTEIAMLVLLSHSDREVLEQETQAIFALEQSGELF